MAMANAVEGRFPFLDHRVVELAARIPPRLKLRGLTEKHVLREAARGLVPAAMAARPKQPYRAPDSASFCSASAPDYVGRLLSGRGDRSLRALRAEGGGEACRQRPATAAPAASATTWR